MILFVKKEMKNKRVGKDIVEGLDLSFLIMFLETS